jgi:hypothetical protein
MQPGRARSVHCIMSDDPKPEGATNDRPLNETIAGTGPGIPDEALGPGEELQVPPTDEQVAAAARALGAPVPAAEEKSD